MKVYVGKVCYDNGCDVWKTVERVFDDEAKALIWMEESFTDPDTGSEYEDPDTWREYEEFEVE